MNAKYEFHFLNGMDQLRLWADALETIPSSNFFHTNDWLSFVERRFNLRLKRILIFKSGRIEGVFPLFEKKYGFFKIAGSPLVAENNPYMGFAIREKKNIASIMPEFDRFLKDEGIDFFRASFDHSLYNNNFQMHGYTLEEKRSFRIDLSEDQELLWKGIGPKTRNMVRKAVKNNLVLVEDSSGSMIDSYYEMSMEVYARQGLPPLVEKSYYLDLYSEIIHKGFGKIFMVNSPEGDPVAGAIILIHRDKAYYLDGASFRSYSNLGTNNFLQWNIIETLKKSGVVSYDMLGGDIPSIAKFKKSFGTVNHPTVYVEKPLSALSRLLRRLYTKQKNLSKKIIYSMNRIKKIS